MPEIVGSALYSLDLDTGKFDKNLQSAEARLKSGIPAAAGPATAATKKLGSETEKLGAAGTKAAVGSQELKQAVSQTAQSLSQSVPLMSGFGAAAGTASTAMPLLTAGLLAGFVAFQGLNAAVEHFTGSSILEQLSGEAAAHERAAKAAKEQGDALDFVNRVRREGVSATTADDLAIKKITEDIAKSISVRNAAADAAKTRLQELTTGPQRGRFPGGQAGLDILTKGSNEQFNADLEQATKNVIALKPNLAQLNAIALQFPEVTNVKAFSDELNAQEKAAGAAGTALAKYEAIINEALKAQQEFTNASADLQALTNVFSPQIAELELEKDKLEQTKKILGDAFGPENQARLDAVTGKLGILKSNQDIVTDSVALFNARMNQTYGVDAPAKIKQVEAAIARLPTDQKIELAIVLPNLSKISSAFAEFIRALQAGASVEIAVRLAGVAAFPAPTPPRSTDTSPIPGETPAQTARRLRQDEADRVAGNLTPVSTAAQEFIDQQNALIKGYNDAAGAAAGATAGTDAAARANTGAGAAASQAAKDTQIWADGIISLSEAMAAGLSAADAAALENTHDAEIASAGLADALFRQQVETEKAARGSESLQIGLVQIATELIKSKRTFEQWNLDEILKPKLDAVKSMIDSVFSQPTKESLALDLKKAKLEREALLLERGGADASKVGQKGTKGRPAPEASADDKRLKAINDQIAAVSKDIDLRRKDFEILKLETEMRDQSVQSDGDLLNANQFLGTALDSLSGSVKGTEEALGVNLFGAALKAASALQAVQAAGGTGFTAAEKHWINGVALNAGEPLPFPGFKWGLDFVPRDNMPALLHYGERVLTRQENQQFNQGNVTGVVNGYGRSDEDILRLMNSALRTSMRRSRGSGAAALPSSYVPSR